MRRRRAARWPWVLGTLVVTGGLVALFTLPGGSAAPVEVTTAPAGAAPPALAHAACRNLAAVQQLVRADAPAPRVFDALHAAQEQVAAAASGDPVWLSLQSGVESVATGLQHDEASTTTLGIAIVRDQCRRAGVTLARFPSPGPGEPAR